MAFDEPHEMSFLMFPCERLRLPPAAVEQVLVTPVSSAQSTASLVAPFLRRLVANLEQPGEPVNCRLADNVLDLLATLFGERTGVPPTDPATMRRALLLAVHGWIEAHLADPDLGPAVIAQANHISVRYLHRLFHDQGTSVARWVRERQLPPRPGGPGAGPGRGAHDRPALGLRGPGPLQQDLQGQLRRPSRRLPQRGPRRLLPPPCLTPAVAAWV